MKDYVRDCISVALRQLPQRMDTPQARFLMLAAGFQESGFRHRRQIGGPARGYWQFEPIGCTGVLTHHTTADLAAGLCITMGVQALSDSAYAAVEFHDCLAAGFARLCFWRLPDPVPDITDSEGMLLYYRRAWAPGKFHPERWPHSYKMALEWM
jgi:hypothetical protein